MADRNSPDSEPTVRTLLRRVLDTADPRTPRLRRSARMRAQRALPEAPPSGNQHSQTKVTTRRRSQRIRSIGKVHHVQASEHLDEQTPRTLLANILLTAPESSSIKPQPVMKPVPAVQVVQLSRRESSLASPELRLPALEPSTTAAPSMQVPGRRRQRLRLSVFEQGLLPASQAESHGNADESAATSSLSVTFAAPLQPQSAQRPGLARRPHTHRAVDMGAFLQDLQDTAPALASPGDNLKALGTPLPVDTVWEDTQQFSLLLDSSSPGHGSVPCTSHSVAEDAERPASPRTRDSVLQNHTQHLAGEAENALARDLLKMSSSILREDSVEPAQEGALEAAVSREESLGTSKVKETARAQDYHGPSVSAGELGGDKDVTETDEEAMDTDGSSGDEDASGRAASPESASGIPEFLQTRQPRPSPEPAPPPTTAVVPSEPAKLPSTAQIRGPRPRAARPRTRQDPYKTGLSHYVKFFSFYAKMSMDKAALEMVEKCLDKYLQHLCDDLDVYAAHAGRKTVKPEDLELLMRRQRLVTDQVPLDVFVERHLPLEYRQLLIPCAFSGNSVFPAQ